MYVFINYSNVLWYQCFMYMKIYKIYKLKQDEKKETNNVFK